jgi:hypothetical protein
VTISDAEKRLHAEHVFICFIEAATMPEFRTQSIGSRRRRSRASGSAAGLLFCVVSTFRNRSGWREVLGVAMACGEKAIATIISDAGRYAWMGRIRNEIMEPAAARVAGDMLREADSGRCRAVGSGDRERRCHDQIDIRKRRLRDRCPPKAVVIPGCKRNDRPAPVWVIVGERLQSTTLLLPARKSWMAAPSPAMTRMGRSLRWLVLGNF